MLLTYCQLLTSKVIYVYLSLSLSLSFRFVFLFVFCVLCFVCCVFVCCLVEVYLCEKEFERAGDCLFQQARLSINKFSLPVQSAAHYMEACKCYMRCGEYTRAFHALQLAVQARQQPNRKHEKNPRAYWEQVMEEGELFNNNNNKLDRRTSIPAAVSTSSVSASSSSSTSRAASNLTSPPSCSLPNETIQPEPTYRRLVLSRAAGPRFGEDDLSQSSSSSSKKGNDKTTNSSKSLLAYETSAPTNNKKDNKKENTSADDSCAPPPGSRVLNRRHSASDLHASNLFPGVDENEVLHLDLLLARLATQLATDLWADLDFRDAVICKRYIYKTKSKQTHTREEEKKEDK